MVLYCRVHKYRGKLWQYPEASDARNYAGGIAASRSTGWYPIVSDPGTCGACFSLPVWSADL